MSQAEQLALFLAGVVAPFIVQLVKSQNLSNRMAYWFSLVVSVAIAVIAMVLVGSFSLEPLDQLLVKLGAVLALANLIYNQALKPSEQPTIVEE